MGKFIIWEVNASCCLGRMLRGGKGKSIKIEVQKKCGIRAPKGKVSINLFGTCFFDLLRRK